MCYTRQCFRLFHVSNLSYVNFRICCAHVSGVSEPFVALSSRRHRRSLRLPVATLPPPVGVGVPPATPPPPVELSTLTAAHSNRQWRHPYIYATRRMTRRCCRKMSLHSHLITVISKAAWNIPGRLWLKGQVNLEIFGLVHLNHAAGFLHSNSGVKMS